jgi:hypothetical protein
MPIFKLPSEKFRQKNAAKHGQCLFVA